MKKVTLFRRLCAVTMGLLLSTIWAMAQITVPSASNTDYVDFTSATLTNVKLDGGYSNKYGVGSMRNATASISLLDIVNETEKQYVLAFKARYNTDNKNITVQIKFTDEESNEYSTEILTIDKNNCTRGTDSYYMLQLTNPLPAGNYTLNVELTSSAGGSAWGANFGNLLVLDPDNFNSLPSTKVDFNKYTDKSSQGGVENGFGNNDGNYKYGIGSFKNGSYIKVPIINTTVQDYVLTYLWKVGNANATNLNITLTRGDNTEVLNQNFPIYNTSDKWHTAAASISKLETGIYTMTITTAASEGWCPNVSNLAIVPKSSYVAYDSRLLKTIDLSKGLATGTIAMAPNKIDGTKNSATAVYIVNCIEAGTYDFSFQGATASGHPSSKVTVQICNAEGSLVGAETEFAITPSTEESIWTDFNTYTINNVELAEGLNIVRLAFATSTGWCANLQNLDFTKTSPINTIPSNSFAMDLGVRADRTNTKFGSTLVDSNQRNSYFIYRVNVTEAGKYTLSIDSECDQPNTKQPSFTVLVTDANGQETSQTFTITNPGEDIKQTETFTTDPIDLPEGICTIKISFASATNNTWTTNLKNMKVNTFAYELVVTDGTDFAPEYDYCTSATYTRSIAAGAYGTICLPFAPDAESLEAYNFYELKFSTLSGTGGEVTFTKVDTLEANKPYIYCLADKDAPEAPAITGGATEVSREAGTTIISGWQMVGSFKADTVDCTGNAIYALNGETQKLMKVTQSLYVPAYRAYIQGTSSQLDLQTLTVRISGPTGIEQISAADVEGLLPATIYDLMGRPVKNPQKGHLYIQGGKKMVY